MEGELLSAVTRLSIAFATILLAGASYLLFLSVAHAGGPPFLRVSIGTASLAALVAFFAHEDRYWIYGFSILALPRIHTLILERPAHHTLLPVFTGFALGALFVYVYRMRKRTLPDAQDEQQSSGSLTLRSDRTIRLWALFWLLLLLVASMGRAIHDYYDPLERGWALADRIYLADVSANYSFFLTMLVIVQFAAPLVLLLSNLILFAPTRRQASVQLVNGLAIGSAANLFVIGLQLSGVDLLWAGTALSRQAGRPPGLLTDSGQSTILLPFLLLMMHPVIMQRTVRPGPRLLVSASILILLLSLAPLQGRAYWLSLASALTWYAVIIYRQRLFRMATGIAIATAIVLFLFPSGVSHSVDRLQKTIPQAVSELVDYGPFAMLERIGPARAELLEANLEIISRSPWTGTGLNSFMVQTAALRGAWPGLRADNPPTLFTGLWGDVGLLGLFLLAPLFFYYAVRTRRFWKQYARASDVSDRFSVLLHTLPLALVPSMFIGYHLVATEFVALILLPFFLSDPEPGID